MQEQRQFVDVLLYSFSHTEWSCCWNEAVLITIIRKSIKSVKVLWCMRHDPRFTHKYIMIFHRKLISWMCLIAVFFLFNSVLYTIFNLIKNSITTKQFTVKLMCITSIWTVSFQNSPGCNSAVFHANILMVEFLTIFCPEHHVVVIFFFGVVLKQVCRKLYFSYHMHIISSINQNQNQSSSWTVFLVLI